MLWWLLLLVSGVQAAHPSDMNKYSCVSQFIPSSPSDRLKEKEHCSVCEAIVENARKWDFDTHLGGLCAGVAEHAMDWVSLPTRIKSFLTTTTKIHCKNLLLYRKAPSIHNKNNILYTRQIYASTTSLQQKLTPSNPRLLLEHIFTHARMCIKT